MEFPLVSIGVPSYNRPVTLERTLNSLVRQTYKNIEIIISDDCSTNKDVEIVINKFLSDERIKYFRQPVNNGPINNFNSINKLNGEYFMRIADDDWLDENYIEVCLDFLLNNPEYSSAYGLARIHDLQGNYVADDSKIDMIQDSPNDRLLNYLKHVDKNGCYYGLMNKIHLPKVRSENYIASDWLIINRVAFTGKYKLLESTHSNLTLGGDSHSFEHMVRVYNLFYLTQFFPYLAIGLNVANDILWRSQAYNKMKILDRSKLAIKCFKVISLRFNIKNEFKQGLRSWLFKSRN